MPLFINTKNIENIKAIIIISSEILLYVLIFNIHFFFVIGAYFIITFIMFLQRYISDLFIFIINITQTFYYGITNYINPHFSIKLKHCNVICLKYWYSTKLNFELHINIINFDQFLSHQFYLFFNLFLMYLIFP